MDDKLKQKIFDELKSRMAKHASKLEVRSETEKAYNLYGTKDVQLEHKLEKGMYFASVMKMKSYVGFYFFPIYTHKSDTEPTMDPDLLKCLKGKSCFHIKKDDPSLYKSIEKALKDGMKLYKKIGWV